MEFRRVRDLAYFQPARVDSNQSRQRQINVTHELGVRIILEPMCSKKLCVHPRDYVNGPIVEFSEILQQIRFQWRLPKLQSFSKAMAPNFTDQFCGSLRESVVEHEHTLSRLLAKNVLEMQIIVNDAVLHERQSEEQIGNKSSTEILGLVF